MARQSVGLFSFNRGEISKLALGRIDIEHLRLAAQSQINWLPRVLGPMMLRPGTQYIGQIFNNQPAKVLSFVSAFADTALLELTANVMRVWRNDALITRAAVSTTIKDFPLWTTATTGEAAVATAAGSLTFSGMNNGASASAYTQLAILNADLHTEHALRFTVTAGPVNFSIGSVAGLGDVFAQETLDTGTYSMAFTPGISTVFVQFSPVQLSNNSNTTAQSIPTWKQQVGVSNISVEAPGVLTLPTPWGSSVIGVPGATPSLIRYDQSANVIFVAASGTAQYQINRYSPTSWSIVPYRSVKGPLAAVPSNAAVTLTPGALSGNTTLTASSTLFEPSDVGTLMRVFESGQAVIEDLCFQNTFTDAIQVTGVSYVSTVNGGGSVVNTATADRNFSFNITGTWVGTLTLQRSFTGPTTGFSDYLPYTANQTGVVITDGLNNEIVWYRIGFKSGQYTSGTASINIFYAGGGAYGVGHITQYVSPTVVNIEVLVPFWGLSPSADWLQSEWSSSNGYPTSVALHEGRLWWSGADKWWGSVSDDYSNFDYDATGAAAPIDQAIGKGPIANINWMVSIDHLLAGADTSIITAMSDAIESPLTPTNFTLRRSVTNGAFPIQAAAVDQRVVYIDQSGRKLYELIYDIRLYNYKPTDLTRLNPDIGLPGFVDMAVQRQPDTRINLVRTDGIIASFIYDADDDVQAFWRVQTLGAFESVAVLPGSREDQVYVVVNRTINGQTVRYLEKFARIDECQGDALTKCVDAHLVYQGAATNALAGFTHLAGQTVSIWGSIPAGDYQAGDYNPGDYNVGPGPVTGDLGTTIVSNTGTINIPGGRTVTAAVIGLPYTAEFISAKLEYAAKLGSALNKVKRIDHIGFSLVNTHCLGIRYGSWTASDQTNVPNGIFTPPAILDPMPGVESGAVVGTNYIWPQYDENQIEFGSDYDTDLRIYLQAASPRPVTVLGVSFDIQTSD